MESVQMGNNDVSSKWRACSINVIGQLSGEVSMGTTLCLCASALHYLLLLPLHQSGKKKLCALDGAFSITRNRLAYVHSFVCEVIAM